MMKHVLMIAAIALCGGVKSYADCQSVRVGDFEIEADAMLSETKLVSRAQGSGRELFSVTLPESGQDQECLEMEAFEKKRLVFVYYRTGSAGTRELVHYKVLLAYKVAQDGALALAEKITLSEIHSTDKTKAVAFQKRSRLTPSSKGVRVSLKDLKTGTIEHIEVY